MGEVHGKTGLEQLDLRLAQRAADYQACQNPIRLALETGLHGGEDLAAAVERVGRKRVACGKTLFLDRCKHVVTKPRGYTLVTDKRLDGID